MCVSAFQEKKKVKAIVLTHLSWWPGGKGCFPTFLLPVYPHPLNFWGAVLIFQRGRHFELVKTNTFAFYLLWKTKRLRKKKNTKEPTPPQKQHKLFVTSSKQLNTHFQGRNFLIGTRLLVSMVTAPVHPLSRGPLDDVTFVVMFLAKARCKEETV